MTQALRRLHSQKNSQNYLFILSQIVFNHEESIFSKEIYDLTISLQQILQILLSISETFFENDQAETLIKLYRNIHFFKSLQNYYALGITHNNIGAILANQGHYQHALEHYQQSIIYARYEIQDFCRQHPSSQNYKYLSNYCYDNNNTLTKKAESKIYENKNKAQKKFRIADYLTKILSQFKNLIQKKQNEDNTLKKLNSDEEESINKFLDAFGNNLIDNDGNDQQDEQKDEHYLQRIQLLLNLYYRKVNYNLSLIWFQTSIDKYYSDINKNNKLQNNSSMFQQAKLV
ncbi:tetratricopeptide repeat protein (macronuclear) [Tetrahymena thermophila SB210]|uniref:Tetratricopeptide repeat protein n=1 Tax=Tetrahymena thermophila (strain SB210) TaxID=312017 RepID=W7XGL8_TETTS|nr:tetratricopeptide repeat protein [Tetrahymena thermophila SB210]EWS72084.1 tetratricopeptide repeat protein [Tetrahymena thermophila SB210]|eukprot:XP_012655395.1 tetratricopeptide repeat protein [Tetrahymena thermophila SB210]